MMAAELNFDDWVCPLPLSDYQGIVMGHGGGGKLSTELIKYLFLPAFGQQSPSELRDSAILDIAGQRLAFSTDSYVVRPLFFPGGNIGDLAVNGTINDLAMSGARPLFMSCGFILEEGMPLDRLALIAESMGRAAHAAGVQLVTGDTKVVDRGHGDGVYINTSGIGLIPDGIQIGPTLARPGDKVIISGQIGLHGIAILSIREGLEFGAQIESDTTALHDLVASMLEESHEIHVMRDPTRGGVASALNEIAQSARVGIEIEERALPVPDIVRAACELLGMDPLYIANEGKLIAIVPATIAEAMLRRMQQHPQGRQAAIIGQVRAEHPGLVVTRTALGATRIVDTLVGEQLPRIC